MPARPEIHEQQRWRFNHTGQLVTDEDSTDSWELADEIGRLRIADVSADLDDRKAPLLAKAPPLDQASNPSAGSSPQSSEHNISHSRASSIDTTISSSHESVSSGRLLSQPTTDADLKDRQRPYSQDLTHLPDDLSERQQHWIHAASQEQPSYPSLSNHHHVPRQQTHPTNMYGIRNADRDDQLDYPQSRTYNQPHPHSFASPPPPNVSYRQPRQYAQQGIAPGASPLPYPGHTSHLSLGNTQHLYDMMLPAPGIHENPVVARVQQQHNVFRGAHHHSASDPSNLRDAATLALLNGNMGPFAPGMFPPAPMIYPNQYYGQDVAQIMAARLQVQYTGPYAPPAQPLSVNNTGTTPTATTANGSVTGGQAPGPSANNRKLGLYKTELCRSWEEKGSCRYGAKCQFAHGEEEIRKVARHPKYKTEICRTFWVSGSCPYGKRCCFIHTELPNSGTPPAGATPGADSSTSQTDGRARSMSTNSDPNDASISLLARIKNNAAVSPPVDSASSTPFQFGSRPPTGSLRVDTSALDGPSIQKQNKSAYPSFASNGILLPAPEPVRAKSPAPVTAGPDLGRFNAARLEIVGFNGGQKKGHQTGNPRHSFSGELDLGLTPSPSGSYELAPNKGLSGRANGHVRAGSAGNWGSIVRSNLVSNLGRGSQSPAGDIMSASPWGSGEMSAVRLHEKAWA